MDSSELINQLAIIGMANIAQYWGYFTAFLQTYAVLIAIAYFLPGVVASLRGSSNHMAVWVITLFLGWTYVGWVVALAMALSGKARSQRAEIEQLRKELRSIRWLLETYIPKQTLETKSNSQITKSDKISRVKNRR